METTRTHAPHTGQHPQGCISCYEYVKLQEADARLRAQFVTIEQEHPDCEGCDRAADHARTMASVTGSRGAESVDDGTRLNEPHYHRAVVKRVTEVEHPTR